MKTLQLWPFLCLLFLSAIISTGAQTKSVNDDLNYYDDYELYSAGYDVYNDGYDEGWYFDPETGNYDDVYGDYFFDDEEEVMEDCRLTDTGEPTFNGTRPCDVKIDGVDSFVELLPGGLDGVYKVVSCESGRPMYKREGSAPNEDRVLWFSGEFRDWDISNGTAPRSDDILMYGGLSGKETRPQYVQDSWNVASEFKKVQEGMEQYVPVQAKFSCADGSKFEVPKVTNFGQRPLANDAELEAQYRMVMQRPRRATGAEVSMGLVSVMVIVGLGVVVGLPYLVARQRKLRKLPGIIPTVLDLAGNRRHKH